MDERYGNPGGVRGGHEAVLVWTALTLFGAVIAAMCLSLASCGMLAGAGTGPNGRSRGAADLTGERDDPGSVRPMLLVPRRSVRGVADEPRMRVRIAKRVESVDVSGGQGLWLAVSGVVRRAERLDAVRGGEVVRVSRRGSQWLIDGPAGSRVWSGVGAELGVDGDDSERAPDATQAGLTVNGVGYPGRLRLCPRSDVSDTAFDVVELVPLESYLPGVIASELIPGWPLEVFRVQAVCARSYAVHEHLRSVAAGRTFDVENTTADQVYGGSTPDETAHRAVRDTRGVILTYGDAPLRAYYASTCGGRAASAKDTWPTGRGFEYNLAPPLQGHERPFACQSSPLFRWSVIRRKGDLVRRMRAFGTDQGLLIRKIGDLHSVKVEQTNATGRPSQYRVIEPGGKWYLLSAEQLRLACNWDAPGLGDIDKSTRVNSGDLQVKVAGDTVTIDGRGFGHGVGMCQFCTYGFVLKGEHWRSLLRMFYPGASIVRAYD